MPAIKKELRKPVLDNIANAKAVGDLCYVFAKFFWRLWKAEPRWTTYHKMCRMVKSPHENEDFANISLQMVTVAKFERLDVQVAAEEALREFNRKVMARYENGNYQANGEVFCDEEAKNVVSSTSNS